MIPLRITNLLSVFMALFLPISGHVNMAVTPSVNIDNVTLPKFHFFT